MNGKLYGNRSNGYGYSPDRSRDVDRFNPSTRANYQLSISSPYWQNYWAGSYTTTAKKSGGYYDGRGGYHED